MTTQGFKGNSGFEFRAVHAPYSAGNGSFFLQSHGKLSCADSSISKVPEFHLSQLFRFVEPLLLFYKPSGIKGWIWFFTKWFGMLFLSLLLFAVILGLLAPESKTTANPSSRTQSPKPMNESTFIDNAVARDVIKQYELVKKHGSDIEVCVHAQIVQAAYLQGKNEEKFVEWQKIARADCKKAGMPE